MSKDMKINILVQAADKASKTFGRITGSTKGMKNQLQESTRKIRDLEKAARKMDALDGLKTKTDANANALKQAQLKAQALSKEMFQTGNQTKTMANKVDKARKEVNRLKEAGSRLRESTHALQGDLKKAGYNTGNLSRDQRRLKMDMTAATRAADKQGNALAKLTKRQNTLAAAKESRNKMLDRSSQFAMGGAAVMASSGAALGIGGSMLSHGINFGEQMSGVGAIARLDKSSEAFKALKEQAQELGATTSFSATEAAQGMQFLSMAGFDANQTLAAMPGMLDLAKAGNTDLATTADIASNVLSGFGLQASEMSRLGDVMTATFTRSNVDLGMLGETMKYTAPMAKEFGSSVEEVAAMTGLLGNVGIQGSQAGTALRGMYTRLSKLPREAGAALRDLGIETADAAGNARPLFDIMTDIASATEGMGSADRLKAFTQIAGTEAGSAFAELVGKSGAGEIRKFTEVLKNAGGEASRVAGQMGDNAAGDIKSFWSAVEGMNIALTETNDSPLRELIQDATGLVRGIQGWIKENPRLAGGLLRATAVLGALVFTGGMFISILAGMMGPIAMIKYGLVAILPVLKGIGAALLMNPIGLALTAMAVGAYLIWDNWEWLADKFAGFWEWLKSGFAAAGNWIKNNWQHIVPGGGLIKFMMEKFGDTPAVNTRAMAPAANAVATRAAAANNNTVGGDTVTIQVTAAPGQNEEDIARQTARQFEVMQQQKRRRQRGRFSDGVN